MAVGKLRVALVSTPHVAVPPPGYGGTELVVAELATALAAQGCDVVVYATGDSRLRDIEVRSLFAEPVWPPQDEAAEAHAAWALRDIARDGRFDLIHSHSAAVLRNARRAPAPMVHTVHDNLDPGVRMSGAGALLVAISRRQAERSSGAIDAVVHHGLAPERFEQRPDGGYLLFIGRYCRVKAPHVAIEVAQRAGLPIVLAGRAHDEPGEGDYFEAILKPLLELDGVTDVGPVGGAKKQALLAGARALLFPVQWEEPFGLVMIESMLSGVPVLAMPRGAVPEVVEPGVTGELCDDVASLIRAARGAQRFDRAAIRGRALQRFSSARMARDYLAVYREALARGAAGPRRVEG